MPIDKSIDANCGLRNWRNEWQNREKKKTWRHPLKCAKIDSEQDRKKRQVDDWVWERRRTKIAAIRQLIGGFAFVCLCLHTFSARLFVYDNFDYFWYSICRSDTTKACKLLNEAYVLDGFSVRFMLHTKYFPMKSTHSTCLHVFNKMKCCLQCKQRLIALLLPQPSPLSTCSRLFPSVFPFDFIAHTHPSHYYFIDMPARNFYSLCVWFFCDFRFTDKYQ